MMTLLESHALSVATLLPAAGALLIVLVRSKELAKLLACLVAAAVLALTSWIAWEYHANAAAHPSIRDAFTAQAGATLDGLEPGVRRQVEAALLEKSATPGAALRGDAAAAFAEVRELRLAAAPAESTELRFVERAPWIQLFHIHYFLAVDGLSIPLLWLTALVTLVSLLYSWNVEKLPRAYFALFLLLETGLLGVFAALDLFLFYVYWEVVLLPMFLLIGIWGGPRRLYAAVKFFIYTLVGSVLLLVAFLYLYFAFSPHTFNLLALTSLAPGLTRAVQAWLFAGLFVGFAIKIPVFPFHTWLPDAHVEAPTAASMVLAGLLLKMGVYGFFRFLYPLVPGVATSHEVVWLVGGLGVVNLVYGALVAMAQTDFKALVAYSSISALGYCLIGLAALTGAGLMGAALQSFNHGLESPLLFCLVGVVYDRAHHRNLNDMGGLAQQMPRYAALAFVGFFAALGLPGLNMFWGEAMTVLGAYEPTSLLRAGAAPLRGLHATWLVYVALSAIVITAAYVLWTVQRVFLGPRREKTLHFPDLSGREVVALVPLAALCVVFGVLPQIAVDFMAPSLAAILETIKAGIR